MNTAILSGSVDIAAGGIPPLLKIWEKTKGTPTEARIGIVNDDQTLTQLGLADGWVQANRPAAQTESSVGPGETATFTFSIKGVRQGSYPLRLRPVIDGLTWLDDQGIFLQITIN